MKALTIKVVIKGWNVTQNGQTQVYIRVTKNRLSRFISTGIMVEPVDFDKISGLCKTTFKKGTERHKNSLHEQYNDILRMKVNEIKQQIADESNVFSAARVKKNIVQKEKAENVDFFQYAERQVEQLRNEKRLGNAKVYQIAAKGFSSYYKNDLPILDIDSDLIADYVLFLKKKGLKYYTVKNYIITLQAIYNRAISDRLIKPKVNPFKNVGLNTIKNKTTHRALSADEIELLKNYAPETAKERLALDIWLFSYYNRGINIKDIAYLTKESIKGNTITYARSKTHKNFIQQLHPSSIEILQRQPNTSEFIFPILSKVDLANTKKVYIKIVNISQRVNSDLKVIGEKLNLSLKLTTYTARHSYATQLLRNGAEVAKISQALGHSNIQTTQAYLAAFDDSEISKLGLML